MPSLTATTDRDEQGTAVRAGDGDCRHRMRVVGYVRRGLHSRMDCGQPLRAVCMSGCGRQEFWRCNVGNADQCPDCARRKRAHLARLVHLGATDRLEAGSGYVYFLTLNGPGEKDHRQWRQGRGGPDRPECSCHHVWASMSKGDWNSEESGCWNRLRLALSRLTGGSLTYIGAVEVQKRGVLHRHVVLATETPLEPAEVGRLALSAGYGCVHDLQPLRSAQKAAHYVSKYVMKAAGERGDLPWRAEVVDAETGEIRRLETVPTFRSWSASRSWGYTLKGLREIARAQARARARYLEELAELLAEDTAEAAGLAPAGEPSGSPP